MSMQADRFSGTKARARTYRRHSFVLRLLHWMMAAALLVMLLSGLQIFNADPALHWGESSYAGTPPFFQIASRRSANGTLAGVTQIGPYRLPTTGVLGASATPHGLRARAFPDWLTIPSGGGTRALAEGRRWHFFFAWLFTLIGLVYVGHAVFTGRLRRDLLPTRSDWRGFWASVRDHLLLRRPKGEAARRYNVLQKLSYLSIMFGLLPGMILVGLAMSPWLDSVWPGWVDWLGGRQSARSLHFIGAWLIVLFVLVHVFEVIVTGPVNNLRSMITGNYRLEPDSESADERSAR